MKYMTVAQLYDKLCSEKFQDPANSDLFYNFFVYLYPADRELEMREQIADIKEKILRPTNNIDVLTLDIFEEFCNFLQTKKFGNEFPSKLQFYLDLDKKDPKSAMEGLGIDANGKAFLKYIHERIMEHVSKVDEYKRPYVFMYGLGNIYPYLRASTLLSKYESLNETQRYKIILFYQGEQEGSSFRLFNALSDNHTYRAIVLMNE